MLARSDSGATTEDESEEDNAVPRPAQPTRLKRNVSGYDQRQDRLLVSLDSLVRESEPRYYRLLASCEAGNARRVRKLLQQLSVKEASQLNPNKDSPSYGLTSLHVAGSADVCALLIEHGVDVDVAGLNGQTPLHVHTHNNDVDIVALLLNAGATVDAKTLYNGSTPLQWAVAADNKPIVQLLVRAGSDVAYENLTGNTALHMAASVDVARYLVAKGARPDVSNHAGRIPLEEAAARATAGEELEVAIFLLDLSRRAFEAREAPASAIAVAPAAQTLHGPLPAVPEANASSYHSLDAAADAAERARTHALHMSAKHKWRLVKRAFLNGGSSSPVATSLLPKLGASQQDTKGPHANQSDGDTSDEDALVSVQQQREGPRAFFRTFFDLIVKERPTLALRVLDQQRKFLYWENSAQVFSYDTSLLGSVPHSSFALKEMVYLDAAGLLSHRIVQFVVSCRWTLFTREMVFFESGLHVLFCALLVGTSLTADRHMPFAAAAQHADPGAAAVLLLHAALCALNLRYMLVHVVQAALTRNEVDGSRDSARRHGSLFAQLMHCRLRNESYYLLPHMLILVSQVLRCLPSVPPSDATVAHTKAASRETAAALVAADVLCAVCIPRMFYRALGFCEGLRSVGVAMATIRGMVSRNAVYFAVLLTLVTGFSLSMAVLFRDEPDSQEYGSVAMAWTSLFMFVFNLDVDALNAETVQYRKWFAFAMLFVYMVLVALVVVNLLVAVMTNTYEEISRNSEAEWLLQRARLVVYFEHQELAMHAILFARWPRIGRARARARVGDCENGAHADEDEDLLPAGPSKHYVREVGDRVQVELPRAYVNELNAFRARKRGCFLRSRDAAFRLWQRLRGSKSFTWPTGPLHGSGTGSGSGSGKAGGGGKGAPRASGPAMSGADSPLGTLEDKADLVDICAFTTLRGGEDPAHDSRFARGGRELSSGSSGKRGSSGACELCSEVLDAVRELARHSKRAEADLRGLRASVETLREDSPVLRARRSSGSGGRNVAFAHTTLA